jgi:hypothetical protein
MMFLRSQLFGLSRADLRGAIQRFGPQLSQLRRLSTSLGRSQLFGLSRADLRLRPSAVAVAWVLQRSVLGLRWGWRGVSRSLLMVGPLVGCALRWGRV